MSWGGKRIGAGRKVGPARVKVCAFVLPKTAARLDRLARSAGGIGKGLDLLLTKLERENWLDLQL